MLSAALSYKTLLDGPVGMVQQLTLIFPLLYHSQDFELSSSLAVLNWSSNFSQSNFDLLDLLDFSSSKVLMIEIF